MVFYNTTLQQKVSLYAEWFHWILKEFTSYSEWGLVKKQWIHWSSEWGLVNCTHIFLVMQLQIQVSILIIIEWLHPLEPKSYDLHPTTRP